MNDRRLYRQYAQFKGNKAKEFVRIESQMYDIDTLVTRDYNGKEERTIINYKEFANWIIRSLPNNF